MGAQHVPLRQMIPSPYQHSSKKTWLRSSDIFGSVVFGVRSVLWIFSNANDTVCICGNKTCRLPNSKYHTFSAICCTYIDTYTYIDTHKLVGLGGPTFGGHLAPPSPPPCICSHALTQSTSMRLRLHRCRECEWSWMDDARIRSLRPHTPVTQGRIL